MFNMRLKIEVPSYSEYSNEIKSLISLFLEDSAVYFRAEFDWNTNQLLHMSAMLYTEHTAHCYWNMTELGAILYDSNNDLFSPTHCIDGGASVNEPYGFDNETMDPVRNLRCINSIGDINTVLAQANTYLRFYELDNHGGYYDFLSAFKIPEITIPIKITPYVNSEDVVDATDQLPSFLQDLQNGGIVKIPIDKTRVNFNYTFDLRTTSFTVKDLDTNTFHDLYYKIGIVRFSKEYLIDSNISLPHEGEEEIYWEQEPINYSVRRSEIIASLLNNEQLNISYDPSNNDYYYLNLLGKSAISFHAPYHTPGSIGYKNRLDNNSYPGNAHFTNIILAPIVDLINVISLGSPYYCFGFMYMRLYNQDGSVCNLDISNLDFYLKESINDSYTRIISKSVNLYFTDQSMDGGFVKSITKYYFTASGSQDQNPVQIRNQITYPVYSTDGNRIPYRDFQDVTLYTEYFDPDDGTTGLTDSTLDIYFDPVNDNGYLSFLGKNDVLVKKLILN